MEGKRKNKIQLTSQNPNLNFGQQKYKLSLHSSRTIIYCVLSLTIYRPTQIVFLVIELKKFPFFYNISSCSINTSLLTILTIGQSRQPRLVKYWEQKTGSQQCDGHASPEPRHCSQGCRGHRGACSVGPGACRQANYGHKLLSAAQWQ